MCVPLAPLNWLYFACALVYAVVALMHPSEIAQVQSRYFEILFGANTTELQRWEFTDELLEALETTGFVAGGMQNPSVLELAVDNLSDTDSTPAIEEHIRSRCAKHPCVIDWRQRDEAEIA